MSVKLQPRPVQEVPQTYRWIIPTILLALACSWAIYVHCAVKILPYDDAFITYRYVENAVAGKGPVYNFGQRVFGVSTPLYFGWLVGLKTLLPHADLPTLAVRTNALWFCLSGIGVFVLLRRCTSSFEWAAIGALVILPNQEMIQISTGGMESYMFTAIAIFSLYAASCRRPVLFGVLAGLAILARLEGVWLIPIGFLAFYTSWRRITSALAPIVLLVLIWVIPATIYFGTPLPHSVIAKSKPMYTLPRFLALRDMMNEIPYTYLSHYGAHKYELISLIFILIVLIGTFLCGNIKRLRETVAYGPGLLLLGIFLMYAVGNPRYFPWYRPFIFLPLIVTILLSGFAIASNISGHLAGSSAKWRHRGRYALNYAIASCLLMYICTILLQNFNSRSFAFTNSMDAVAQDPERLRCIAYRQCAEYLNSIQHPDDHVVASEIGAFGYYYNGYVLDSCGLVSPEALPFCQDHR